MDYTISASSRGAGARNRRPPSLRGYLGGIAFGIDLLALLVAGALAGVLWELVGGQERPSGILVGWTGALLLLLFAALSPLFGAYRRIDAGSLVGGIGLGRALGALAVAACVLVASPAALVQSSDIAFGAIASIALPAALAIVLGRVALARLALRWLAEGRLATRIAIVGASEQGAKLVAHLTAAERAGLYEVVGVFDDRRNRAVGFQPEEILGTTDDLVARYRDLGVEVVMIALPWSTRDRLVEIARKLRDIPVDVCLSPDLIGYHLPLREVRDFDDLITFGLWQNPLRHWRGVAKRAEDLIIGSLILVATLPVLLLAAIAIRLESRGPILIRQARFGFDNQPISIFKLRTMYVDVGDPSGARATAPNDPRVTRVGRWLRRTNIDELPQLWNVLRGEMSLVGPRAHPIEMRVLDRYYYEAVQSYAARHRVRPGITGLAQVNGYRGLVDTMEKAQKRLELDLYYIENWSVILDLQIMFRTLVGARAWKNAY